MKKVNKEQLDYLIEIEYFLKEVEHGSFIDDDGHGYLIDKNKNYINEEMIYPSDLKFLNLENVKYILWFNK